MKNKMFFEKEIDKIMMEKNINKITFFVDMDGVIADYRFGEGKNILNNVENIYLKKRPIKTTIKVIKKLKRNKKFDFYILSSCIFDNQVIEKEKWIKRNIKFIEKEKIKIVKSENIEDRKEKKVLKILEIMKKQNLEYSVLIDDTHEILFLAERLSEGKIIPMHVITILD